MTRYRERVQNETGRCRQIDVRTRDVDGQRRVFAVPSCTRVCTEPPGLRNVPNRCLWLVKGSRYSASGPAV